MSSEAPQGQPKSYNSLIALIVAIAVGAIWFINTGGLARLLPNEYNVVVPPTASAEVDTAFAQGDAGGAQVAPAEATTSPAEEPASAVVEEPAAESPATAAATPTTAPAATATAAPTSKPTVIASPTFPATINGLPTVAWDDLPPQAWVTIELIDQGGPFPYDRDGITFQNREGLLPRERSGFYREYTVETPGSSDRGARRIIEGEDGVLYYTDDHYDSFSVVVR